MKFVAEVSSSMSRARLPDSTASTRFAACEVDPEAFVRRWAGYTAEELLPHLRDSARRAADRIIAGHDDEWNPDVLDGYLAAIINYRFLAHGLWTTEETIAQLQPA